MTFTGIYGHCVTAEQKQRKPENGKYFQIIYFRLVKGWVGGTLKTGRWELGGARAKLAIKRALDKQQKWEELLAQKRLRAQESIRTYIAATLIYIRPAITITDFPDKLSRTEG